MMASKMVAEQLESDGGAMKEGGGRRCCLFDDTKVYPTKSVYKPSLIVFDYVKRERVRIKLLITIFLGSRLA
jgi:hypothetical protein